MNAFKKVLPYLFTFCLFAVGFYAAKNVTDILDWWRLRDYKPSAIIISLADESGMNSLGRRLFYVHDPAVLDKSQFRNNCTVGEATIVLGCYITHRRIYIYDVEDERLEGVEEVTAAHEMLHAAYDRLSPSEKESLGKLLDDAFERVTDQRVIENVATYRTQDPSIVHNELHSILGTEVRQLPQALEEYYKKYFVQRLAVVEKAERYATEFQAREDKITAFDEQLSQKNGEITRLQAELREKSNALALEKKRIEGLRNDANTYNMAVVSYNADVNSYNTQVNQVKKLIDEYNVIVVERNAIAFEERELVEAIDTRVDSL